MKYSRVLSRSIVECLSVSSLSSAFSRRSCAASSFALGGVGAGVGVGARAIGLGPGLELGSRLRAIGLGLG